VGWEQSPDLGGSGWGVSLAFACPGKREAELGHALPCRGFPRSVALPR